MSTASNTQRIDDALEELRTSLASSPEALSLLTEFATELYTLHLSDCLDEHLAVLDDCRTCWDMEDVQQLAMELITTLVRNRGAVPTAEQSFRLKKHGWKPAGESSQSSAKIRTFTRKLR